MITKVRAAKLAARSGANTIIAGGAVEQVLVEIANGESVGTLLLSGQQPLAARKQWLAGRLQLAGTLILDDGAVTVLKESGKSLLPVGVKAVEGSFQRGDLVSCVTAAGVEIARGLVNYSAEEAAIILGAGSRQIEGLLGYPGEKEMIHRSNLVLM